MPAIPPPAVPPLPGLAPTSSDLISSSLRLIGFLAAGETADGGTLNDALAVFNQMNDGWMTERLTIFTLNRNVYALTGGVQTYTLGAGSAVNNFSQIRPPKIEYYSIINLNNPAQPLELPLEALSDSGWQDIPVKNVQSALPTKIYNDGSFPQMNLSYWPIPTIAVNTALYVWAALTQAADLTTVFAMPPGYARALRYNLALDLAAEFGGNPENLPLIAKIAMESKGAIKSRNITPLEAVVDPAILNPGSGYYNYLSDQMVGRS